MWRNLDYSVMKLDMVQSVLVQQHMQKTKNKIAFIEYLYQYAAPSIFVRSRSSVFSS